MRLGNDDEDMVSWAFYPEPKNPTGTDPKISDPKPNRKFISIYWVQKFSIRKNRNQKEPIRIDPEPKNRPGPDKNRFISDLKNTYPKL